MITNLALRLLQITAFCFFASYFPHSLANVNDESARAFAGFRANTRSEVSLANYGKTVEQAWSYYLSSTLQPMIDWAAKELPVSAPKSSTVFYPFSGPDLPTAYAMRPEADRYILVAIQHAGRPVDIEALSVEDVTNFMGALRGEWQKFSQIGFFLTNDLDHNQSKSNDLRILPTTILMAFARRLGFTVENILPLKIKDDGSDVEALKAASTADWSSVRLELSKEQRKVVVDYIRIDLSDANLTKHSNQRRFIETSARYPTLLKAASHLPQNQGFTIVRDAIVSQAPFVVQDETGIEYSLLSKSFSVQLYGNFTQPHHLFNPQSQKSLAEAYKQDRSVRPLRFRIGYKKKSGSALQVALKPEILEVENKRLLAKTAEVSGKPSNTQTTLPIVAAATKDKPNVPAVSNENITKVTPVAEVKTVQLSSTTLSTTPSVATVAKDKASTPIPSPAPASKPQEMKVAESSPVAVKAPEKTPVSSNEISVKATPVAEVKPAQPASTTANTTPSVATVAKDKASTPIPSPAPASKPQEVKVAESSPVAVKAPEKKPVSSNEISVKATPVAEVKPAQPASTTANTTPSVATVAKDKSSAPIPTAAPASKPQAVKVAETGPVTTKTHEKAPAPSNESPHKVIPLAEVKPVQSATQDRSDPSKLTLAIPETMSRKLFLGANDRRPAYSAYLKQLRDYVLPPLQPLAKLRKEGESVSFTLHVNKMGQITGAELERGSGSAVFDKQIVSAIKQLKSAPPFPEEVGKVVDALGVVFRFPNE